LYMRVFSMFDITWSNNHEMVARQSQTYSAI
jgi:hypothetical protein